jgi:hypothetical protein
MSNYTCQDCVVIATPRPIPTYRRYTTLVNTTRFRNGSKRVVVENTLGQYTPRSGLRSTIPAPRNNF